MEKITVTWEDIDIRRFMYFANTGNEARTRKVELNNGDTITIECWIQRIKQHIYENKHEDIYEALKDYWTRNSNGNTPEFSAYFSYAKKAFNNPIWAGFKEFKEKGLYIESLGDVYPWPTSK